MERSMTMCETIGINGGCGCDCPVYLEGDCTEPGEIGEGMTEEQKEFHKETYQE